MHSTLSNAYADCGMGSTTTSYDLPSATHSIRIPYTSFIADGDCNSTVSPEHIGYIQYTSSSTIDITLDVRTFGDSVGINSGYFPVTDLPIITTLLDGGGGESFIYRGHTYIGNYYFDTFYSGMRPLYCIINNDTYTSSTTYYKSTVPDLTDDGEGINQLCYVTLGDSGNMFALPIFLHYGAGAGSLSPSHNAPKPCFW